MYQLDHLFVGGRMIILALYFKLPQVITFSWEGLGQSAKSIAPEIIKP